MFVPTYDGDINEHLSEPVGFSGRDVSVEALDVKLQPNGLTTVIAFGGMGLDHFTQEALYGFEGFLAGRLYRCVFVRDSFQCWYQNGIRGFSVSVSDTVEKLSKLVSGDLICCGTSGGGYAAILYGVLLGARSVLALGPQTLLQKGIQCHAHGNLYRLKWCSDPVTDLLGLPFGGTRVKVVVGKDDVVDSFHASRLNGLPDVELFHVDGNHSTMATLLRDFGGLSSFWELL